MSSKLRTERVRRAGYPASLADQIRLKKAKLKPVGTGDRARLQSMRRAYDVNYANNLYPANSYGYRSPATYHYRPASYTYGYRSVPYVGLRPRLFFGDRRVLYTPTTYASTLGYDYDDYDDGYVVRRRSSKRTRRSKSKAKSKSKSKRRSRR